MAKSKATRPSKAPDLSGLNQAGSAAQQPQADAAQDQSQQTAPQADSTQQDSAQASPDASAQDDSTQQDSGSQSDSTLPEDDTNEPVNIQRAFSALNAAITKLLDQSGVRRAFTVPYIDGQAMAEHIKAVGQAATNAGGLGANLLTTSHHATGRGYGYGDGHTVGHGADALRNTVIPKGDENAKDAIQACRSLLNKIGKLIGDDEPSIKVAESQLALVGQNEGANMTLFDFSVALIQIVSPPIQAIGRAHSGTKAGGHSPKLRAPRHER